jgi:hypothetical protein
MIAKCADPKLRDENNLEGYSRKGYEYVLIGACAMTLGCIIPESVKEGMKERYASMDFIRDALNLIKPAPYRPRSDVAGQMYDFGSQGLEEILYTLPKDGPILIDVEEPGNPQSAPMRQDIMEKLRSDILKNMQMTTIKSLRR